VRAEAQEILSEGQRAQLVCRIGVLDHHNPGKSLAHVAFSPEDGSILSYRRFHGIESQSLGDLIEVGFERGGGPPGDWHPVQFAPIPGFVEIKSGLVERW
jgi:hypothetical protein